MSLEQTIAYASAFPRLFFLVIVIKVCCEILILFYFPLGLCDCALFIILTINAFINFVTSKTTKSLKCAQIPFSCITFLFPLYVFWVFFCFCFFVVFFLHTVRFERVWWDSTTRIKWIESLSRLRKRLMCLWITRDFFQKRQENHLKSTEREWFEHFKDI